MEDKECSSRIAAKPTDWGVMTSDKRGSEIREAGEFSVDASFRHYDPDRVKQE